MRDRACFKHLSQSMGSVMSSAASARGACSVELVHEVVAGGHGV